jgi:hypothetical protein
MILSDAARESKQAESLPDSGCLCGKTTAASKKHFLCHEITMNCFTKIRRIGTSSAPAGAFNTNGLLLQFGWAAGKSAGRMPGSAISCLT